MLVTAIIPVSSDLSEHRVRLAEFTARLLADTFGNQSVRIVSAGGSKPAGLVTGCMTHVLRDSWSKPLIMNRAAQLCRSEWLLFVDADMIMNWDTVKRELVANPPDEVCKPFGQLYRLTRRSTERILASGDPSSRQVDREPASGVLGGGVLLVRREFYLLMRGMNEAYSEGFEDSEFNMRVTKIIRPDQWGFPAWHMWHIREDRLAAKWLTRLSGERKHNTLEQLIQSMTSCIAPAESEGDPSEA